MPSVATLLAVLALAAGDPPRDRVVLNDGKTVTGRVVFEDESRVVLRQDRRDTSYARDAVRVVDSRLRHLETLLDNAARADLGRADELELLAAQAEEMGLPGEAQVFWWRLLLLDRERADAHEALGHVKRGSGWLLPVGSRKVDWARRFELARDWGSAWELESLHYRLKSNLPLEANLDLLLDLERLYRAFYELVGGELELYDLTRPLRVQVHADSASYPEHSSELGHYDSGTDTLHVDASRGFTFGVLAHEATHQLLYDTAFRARNDSSGELPPWLDEGLAEYVAACVASVPELVFEAGRPHSAHFHAHAGAKDPLDLTRVLSLSTGDFLSSSGQQLKYTLSYTLVHYLLHGEEERHRAGFFAFLREVYAGKGSATDLKRALDADWRTLEKAWHAYARSF